MKTTVKGKVFPYVSQFGGEGFQSLHPNHFITKDLWKLYKMLLCQVHYINSKSKGNTSTKIRCNASPRTIRTSRQSCSNQIGLALRLYKPFPEVSIRYNYIHIYAYFTYLKALTIESLFSLDFIFLCSCIKIEFAAILLTLQEQYLKMSSLILK